jgi:hypothetical protein
MTTCTVVVVSAPVQGVTIDLVLEEGKTLQSVSA